MHLVDNMESFLFLMTINLHRFISEKQETASRENNVSTTNGEKADC